MAGIIIAYVVGIVTALVTVRYASTKMARQRNSYERSLSECNTLIGSYKADEAYRRGRNDEYMSRKAEAEYLRAQNLRLEEEKQQLQEQLDTQSIFSNAVAQNGHATIFLRRER